ncbi:hypothetical protein [Escherichia albertii]|uniref:hypothetical protein n=1 Tax=Escherichia albertii TaxID=208962 RepID=UPI0007434B7B|nr:hypothetical protein [Escherichia albertii]
MHDVQIVPATREHIVAILPYVRQADILEFLAVTGQTPEQVLELGLRVSTFACAGLINGHVVTIFGVAPASMIGGCGLPWLVSTDALEQYPRTFLRQCRPVVDVFLSVYPRLENYVDTRNHVAIAWLRWLGFRLEEPAPYGMLGLPFHRFHLERK